MRHGCLPRCGGRAAGAAVAARPRARAPGYDDDVTDEMPPRTPLPTITIDVHNSCLKAVSDTEITLDGQNIVVRTRA